MSTRFTALQRQRFRLYLRILAGGAVIGAAYGAALSQEGYSVWVSVLVGVINGLGIAGCISGFEIFLLREGSSMRRLVRLPFALVLLLKTLFYAALISLFVIGAPRLALLLPASVAYAPLAPQRELATVGFSLATTLVIVILLQASALVGRRTFRDLMLGRYRNPRAERRFFLFVDVVGSTAIAERLGALQAHRFLSAVFSATAEPVAACRGEIYQYVGDEIVITWTEEDGKPDARPLKCFFLMESFLSDQKALFKERFAAAPGLRAALHLGEVIAGEVGESRRAIVFHGDVMNTTSRLEHATRETGCRFIASADALAAFGSVTEYELKDLGALALRGRQQPIRASGIELRN